MIYRSRRLEALLGSPLDTVTYADLAALAGNAEATEAEDLDYKREVLAATDEQKVELAKDVAAFANHVGGVLVVGMAEAKGLPSKVMDTDISDAHLRHLHQVIARHTAPVVRFEMRPVPNPTVQGKGVLLIAVPRSPQAPHAVTAFAKTAREALMYPRRGATKTDWLTETEVATAYQRRFSATADRTQRLATVESELLASLPLSNRPHLIVSTVPEVPGDMVINREAFQQAQTELLNTSLIGEDQYTFEGVRIGSRRFIAYGGDPHGYFYNQADLHRDGSGSWALRVVGHTSTANLQEFNWAEPDTVVWLLMSALQVLGAHARYRTGATSTTLVKAALVDAPHNHPRGPARPNLHPLLPFRIDTLKATGQRTPLSTQTCASADSEAVAFLDDLADAGTGLVQAASLLADELVQAFGIAEAAPYIEMLTR
ncbi:helix-turn-helix domain-containing protein [Streptomyces sp. NBC_00564]|uniref:AlbA family DNA-binding domain-containing protein n=1 Tax=Streptomyces sp. NBC_00564 TaxID=2903663 RepID=UPI00352D03AA|nr:ATP-binding protein [Streptomyces sp. NBC_00564]